MGDNVYLGDRDGVRTPMQWTGDRNGGFSRADFAQLYLPPLMDPVYGYQAVNVEAQLRTPTSLLRWLRRFIALRKEHPVFGLGHLRAAADRQPARLRPRARATRTTWCSASTTWRARRRPSSSTSRAYEGRCPEEMFGRSRFPQIGELPYLLTLAPRGFFWFLLREEEREQPTSSTAGAGDRAATTRRGLVEWLQGSAGSGPRAATSPGAAGRGRHRPAPRLELPCAEVALRRRHARALPAAPADDPRRRRRQRAGRPATGRYDASTTRLARAARAHARGRASGGRARRGRPARRRLDPEVRPMGAEQSNSSIVFDGALVLKAFRRLEAGDQPRARDAALPHRARLPRTSRRSAAGTSSRATLVDATLGVAAALRRGAATGGSSCSTPWPTDAGRPSWTTLRRARPGHRPDAHRRSASDSSATPPSRRRSPARRRSRC